MAKHTNGAARQTSARTRQQKSIAHTAAEVAWQEMFRKRRASRKSGLSGVIELAAGGRYHPTKGYRVEKPAGPGGPNSLLVMSIPRRKVVPSAVWDRSHPPANGAREMARRIRQALARSAA